MPYRAPLIPVFLYMNGEKLASLRMESPDSRFYKAEECLDIAIRWIESLYHRDNEYDLPEKWDRIEIEWGIGRFSREYNFSVDNLLPA